VRFTAVTMATSETRTASTCSPQEGELAVSDLVIAKLAGHAARATYGVIRMHPSPMRRLARFLRDSLTEGVDVDVDKGVAAIVLHVVMERGLNLAQVTANVREQVRYEVEQVAGLPVGDIAVHVEDLHE
jgi:uncharacterized alkaline shock family protein YloU